MPLQPPSQASDGADGAEIPPAGKGDRSRGEKNALRPVVTIELKPNPPELPGGGAASAKAAARNRSGRGPYAALAFSVGMGAVFGYLVGSRTGVREAVEEGARVEAASLAEALPWKPEVAASQPPDKREIARVLDQLRSLRAQIEQMRHQAETARPAADPAGAGEIAARFSRLEERLDRLERASADKAATGAFAPAAKPEEPRDDAANGTKAGRGEDLRRRYGLREVSGGLALIQSRSGAVDIVGPGDEIPGAGRVLSIKRRGRGWVVVTTRGVIGAD
jgi:hypothetical protein